MPNAQLTVLLATRNGEHVLPRVLDAYCRVAAPAGGWKMVIVDNGSTDSTPQVIDSFRNDLPLQVLQQPHPGKYRALNSAITAIEGGLVVFTDDDSIPDPTFLTAWAKYLIRRDEYELFGGSIEPLFDVPPPRWLVETRLHFAFMFAERNFPEGPIDPGEIYGPNMAIRTSIFERGFRFDENLGPNAQDADFPMGGDHELCRRAARAGARCWFAKEPLVRHIVRPELLTIAGWATRAYRCGRGCAHEMWETGQLGRAPAAPRSSIGRWYRKAEDSLRHLSRSAADYFHQLRMLSPLPKHRFDSTRAYHWARGFRDECARREANRLR